MAVIFIDGFDKYGPAGLFSPSANFLQGEWTTINANNGSISVAAGLGPTGQAMSVNGGNPTSPFISKTLPVSAARFIGGFRFNANLAGTTGGTPFFEALKGASAAFSLTLSVGGAWSLRTGGTAGTILGTSATAVTANSTHYLEFDVTIGASSSYQVWLDGISVIGPTTGNTGNGQTTVDSISMGLASNSTTGAFIQFDDLYLFDGTTGTNNAPLLTNPCVETSIPSSDVQTQWTNNGSILGTVATTTNTISAPGANELFLRKYTAVVNATLNSVLCVPEGTTAAKFKAVIYPDSGGSPNGQALIATGAEVVGTTSATILTSTFASPPSLVGGTTYWIGFITDTSVNLLQQDTTTTAVKAANTYASGAPGTCPTVTTGQVSWNIWGLCSGTSVNWVSENQNPKPFSDESSIISTTVGNEDLYGFTALTNTPVSIYTVAVKANVRVAGSGARTIDLRTKSVGSDSAGSNAGQSPTTSYIWYDSYFDTNPNGGGAWTGTTLNAASSGIKIAS